MEPKETLVRGQETEEGWLSLYRHVRPLDELFVSR